MLRNWDIQTKRNIPIFPNDADNPKPNTQITCQCTRMIGRACIDGYPPRITGPCQLNHLSEKYFPYPSTDSFRDKAEISQIDCFMRLKFKFKKTPYFIFIFKEKD